MAIKTLMTAKEFARTGPETDGCEPVRGEIVRMPPPKGKQGAACVNASFLLKAFTKGLGQGTVLGNDTELVTGQGPDTIRGVDIMVYLKPSWEGKGIPEDYLTEPPDLAVEFGPRGNPGKRSWKRWRSS